jgi:rhodanese-related sulfurtransferase
MREISVAELKAILPDVNLVDVRDPDEYVAAHVPGAVLIPLATVPVRVNELDKSQTQYIICKSGGRSAQAADFLIAQGYDAVNVAGGTMAWLEAGEAAHVGDQP